MIYLIERAISEMEFDNSVGELQINNKIYDVVVAPRNTGLDSISDHIIDDSQTGMIFAKTDPREKSVVENYITERFGPMSELLLG